VKREALRQIIPQGITEIAETKTWLHLKNSADLVMSCRRYADDYPRMKEFLTVEGVPTELPKSLVEAVGRAELFAKENAEFDYIEVALLSDRVTVTGRGPSGWFSEPKKIKYMGQPLSFTIAPQILSEIVRSSHKCIVSSNRLKVDGGRWQYVAYLTPQETKRESHSEGSEEANRKGAEPRPEKGNGRSRDTHHQRAREVRDDD
jgi:hypothetical protein